MSDPNTPGRPDTWSGEPGADRHRKASALWATGMPVAKIAAECGIPKNALIGRAHRYLGDFPPRESPIKRNPNKPQTPRKPPVVPIARVLPPLTPETIAREHQWWTVAPIGPEEAERANKIALMILAPPPPPLRPAPRVTSCQYPTGDRRFRFECATPAAPGLPYCLEHQALTHVRVAHRNTEQDDFHGAKV